MSSPSLVAPPSASLNDEGVAAQVRHLLQARHGRIGNGLHIRVENGTATLRGLANSYYQKQLWLHGAQKTRGIREIVDQIEVQAAT